MKLEWQLVTRRKSSRECKLVTRRGMTVAQAGMDLDVHADVLRKWSREMCDEAQEAFPDNGKQKAQDAEIVWLRKVEHDILKGPQPTLRRSQCEVRLLGETQRGIAGYSDARGTDRKSTRLNSSH